MAAAGIDDLAKAGHAVQGSRVDLARSSIGIAIRAGTPKPEIGSVDALKRTLLKAASVAYSSSVSGVYISTELFERLGIAAEMRPKSRRVESEPVAAVVARGEAEIGFQQISELRPVAGVDVVGPLPAEVQRVTVFSAAQGANSRQPGRSPRADGVSRVAGRGGRHRTQRHGPGDEAYSLGSPSYAARSRFKSSFSMPSMSVQRRCRPGGIGRAQHLPERVRHDLPGQPELVLQPAAAAGRAAAGDEPLPQLVDLLLGFASRRTSKSPR